MIRRILIPFIVGFVAMSAGSIYGLEGIQKYTFGLLLTGFYLIGFANGALGGIE